MTIYAVKSQVAALVDEDVWSGRRSLDLTPYTVELPDIEEIDLETLRALFAHALSLGLDKETELDQWLAPRLHSALRLAPRVAGDPRVWSWLCFEVGMPYIRVRWPMNIYRLTGDFKRNALSRLWFFAEMARDGEDYADVRRVLRNAGTAQYAMENRYAMYRPAVIAFGRLAEQRKLGFEAMKQLSKRINAYLSLRSLEASGFMIPDESVDEEWCSDRPTITELLESEPKGPRDHEVPEAAIRDLMSWYESLIPTHESVSAE